MEYSPYLCTVKIIPCCLIPCRLPPLLATPPSVATQVFGGISLRRAQEAVIGRRLLSRRKFLAGIPCVVRRTQEAESSNEVREKVKYKVKH